MYEVSSWKKTCGRCVFWSRSWMSDRITDIWNVTEHVWSTGTHFDFFSEQLMVFHSSAHSAEASHAVFKPRSYWKHVPRADRARVQRCLKYSTWFLLDWDCWLLVQNRVNFPLFFFFFPLPFLMQINLKS